MERPLGTAMVARPYSTETFAAETSTPELARNFPYPSFRPSTNHRSPNAPLVPLTSSSRSSNARAPFAGWQHRSHGPTNRARESGLQHGPVRGVCHRAEEQSRPDLVRPARMLGDGEGPARASTATEANPQRCRTHAPHATRRRNEGGPQGDPANTVPSLCLVVAGAAVAVAFLAGAATTPLSDARRCDRACRRDSSANSVWARACFGQAAIARLHAELWQTSCLIVPRRSLRKCRGTPPRNMCKALIRDWAAHRLGSSPHPTALLFL